MVCVGLSVAVCVLGLVCVHQKEHRYTMVEYHAQNHVDSNPPRYNTQKGGHKLLPHYRGFDVSGPKTAKLLYVIVGQPITQSMNSMTEKIARMVVAMEMTALGGLYGCLAFVLDDVKYK